MPLRGNPGGKNYYDARFLCIFRFISMRLHGFRDYKDSGYTETIKTLAIYCKPEEGKCYYVVNDITAGHVDL